MNLRVTKYRGYATLCVDARSAQKTAGSAFFVFRSKEGQKTSFPVQEKKQAGAAHRLGEEIVQFSDEE